MAKTATIKYRADIDGLRAIAVLAVLFFHADLGCSGGYVGVDIFFVISGYLITGLILKDLACGQFHIVEFWERRIRRILPALAVIVIGSVVAGYFLFVPQAFKDLGESVSAQTLLVSNIYFWIKSWMGDGYFAPVAKAQPLLHTWSLAVEEQFYLLFPFVLIALKRFNHKSIVPAIVVLGGLSFALSVYGSYFFSSFTFYCLPTRAWELLIGALLAAIPVPHRSSRTLAEILSWGGVLAILCAVFFYDHNTRFPGVAALLPCLGTASVIWANGHTSTSAGKLLSARPVVYVGLISYSLYLWHWPVLVFFKDWAFDPIPPGLRALLLVASSFLAVLTWRYVETPFRRRLVLKNRAQIFKFAGIATTVLLLTGLTLYKFKGLPARIFSERLAYANGHNDYVIMKNVSLKEAQAGDFIELGTGGKNQPVKLLVWGDSHSAAAIPVLDILCKERNIRGVAAKHDATAPLVGYESKSIHSLGADSVAFGMAVAEFVRKYRVGDVVIIARWDSYTDLDHGTERLHRCMLATISELSSSGARIWIMRQVPKHNWNVPQALVSAVIHDQDIEKLGLPLEEHRKEFQRQCPIFEGIDSHHQNVTILDPTDLFVSHMSLCRVAKGGKALYFDEDHLTVAGAMLLRPLFEPLFGSISAPVTGHD